MPELPDITAYLTALEPRILGRTLERVRLQSVFVLRTADPPITAVEGRTVCELRRIGKRIAVGVEGGLWLVIHLMIAGRLHWRPPKAKLSGRQGLLALDFSDGSLVLTEAGSETPRLAAHLKRRAGPPRDRSRRHRNSLLRIWMRFVPRSQRRTALSSALSPIRVSSAA